MTYMLSQVCLEVTSGIPQIRSCLCTEWMSIDSYGGETITLAKKGWTVPEQYEFGENKCKLRPLSAGETVAWSIIQ